MANVFISYSRKTSDFVRRLHGALHARNQDVWVDWEDIPLSADWWREICAGIEAADTFVFVISKASVSSPVCNFEIAHAVQHGKRIIPILLEMVDENAAFDAFATMELDEGARKILAARDMVAVAKQSWQAIARHNWLFFADEDDEAAFEDKVDKLIDIIDTDLDHVRTHTRLLVRARQWELEGRAPGFLLTATETLEAEAWQAAGTQKEPYPTQLHTEYILASRSAQRKRLRRLFAGVSVALVLTLVLAAASTLLYFAAQRSERRAVANAVTATIAQGQAANNAATAVANAGTATVAQGRAEINATSAANNAATAVANAGTATVAQGRAEISAATATVAQGEAEFQAQTAVAAEATSDRNADIAAFQAQVARGRATAVAEQRDRSQAIALAAQAELELAGGAPDRAPILAAHAIEAIAPVWQAESVLGRVVAPTIASFRTDLLQTPADISQPGHAFLFIAGDNVSTVDMVVYATGEVIATFDTGFETISHISALGGLFAVWDADGNGQIWPNDGGEGPMDIPTFGFVPQAAYWSPNFDLLLIVGPGRATLWDYRASELRADLNLSTQGVPTASWSTDAFLLNFDGRVSVYDTVGDAKLTLDATNIDRAVFRPNGARIATASGRIVQIWDAVDGALLHTLEGHLEPVSALVWSNDGETLVSTSGDGTARLWNVVTGITDRVLFAHEGKVFAAAFDTAGRRLATTGRDGVTRVWDAESGGLLATFTAQTPDAGVGVFWFHDETLAMATADLRTTRFEDITRLSGADALFAWRVWSTPQELVTIAADCCIDRELTDEEARQFGLPIAQGAPPPDEIISCPNALPSRIYPGARGRVSREDPRPLNVRSGGGINFPRIDQTQPDQTFRVLDGPVCSGSFAWFRIRYGIDASEGWVAEGEDFYFVEPLG